MGNFKELPETAPAAVFSRDDGRWLLFDRPCSVITARSLDEVYPCLEEVNRNVCEGWHAAGFIGYEAAPAFDSSLETFPGGPVPLLWFGIFESPRIIPALLPGNIGFTGLQWQPTVTPEEYYHAVRRIREYIARGDTYQVNYSFRLYASFEHDPWNYFRTVACGHPMPLAAWIDAGRYKICSFSPELFFRLDGDRITTQPMKGTSPRGRSASEDDFLALRLQANAKERAENIMIVDMMRNDLGRIACNGSVSVEELCSIRRFRSLLQMVSTIRANVKSPLQEIFGALFPCSSVTGAPKIRTSGIIRELESTPRNLYCGAIGWYSPLRQACFNVAIRTLLVDEEKHMAEYGTGSGIVWESDAAGEYQECQLKAAVVTSVQHDFRLVETLLWTAEGGYFLLERHINRLIGSAAHFSFFIDKDKILQALIEESGAYDSGSRRVRMLVDRSGVVTLESAPVADNGTGDHAPVMLQLAGIPVDSTDCFLFHKTTNRIRYEAIRADYPAGDDILFVNERGEITETAIGNIVVQIDGKFFTPPAACGLLAGVFRGALLEDGILEERVLTPEDIFNADRIFRINSVRKWQECRLYGHNRHAPE